MGAFALALAGGVGHAPPPPQPPAVVLVVAAPTGLPVDFAAFDDNFTTPQAKPILISDPDKGPTPLGLNTVTVELKTAEEWARLKAAREPVAAPKAEPSPGWIPPTPPPSVPAATRLVDANGETWEHVDGGYLSAWIQDRNAQIRAASLTLAAPAYATPVSFRRAGRRGFFGLGGSSCTSAGCQ